MARQTSTQIAPAERKKNPIETYKGFQINISAGIGDLNTFCSELFSSSSNSVRTSACVMGIVNIFFRALLLTMIADSHVSRHSQQSVHMHKGKACRIVGDVALALIFLL